jgi:hypothetical protein
VPSTLSEGPWSEKSKIASALPRDIPLQRMKMSVLVCFMSFLLCGFPYTYSRRLPIEIVHCTSSSLQFVHGGPFSKTLHRTFLARQA